MRFGESISTLVAKARKMRKDPGRAAFLGMRSAVYIGTSGVNAAMNLATKAGYTLLGIPYQTIPADHNCLFETVVRAEYKSKMK